MNLKLIRTSYDSDGIFGVLQKEDGEEICKTLEHSFNNIPKVAAGTYTCERHAPNRLPYETWELQDVPKFNGQSISGILIHIGNYNADSDGCILVGRRILPNPVAPATNMITSSKNTFNRLMDLTKNLNSFTLTIE